MKTLEGTVFEWCNGELESVGLDRALFGKDGLIFTAEWLWAGCRWEIKATSTDGHTYAGSVSNRSGESCRVTLSRWVHPGKPDEWLLTGCYVLDDAPEIISFEVGQAE